MSRKFQLPLLKSCLGTDPICDLELPLFEIKTVPGKGRDLVARFNIAKGTRILYEKPLFTTSNLSPISQIESTITTKLKAISKTQQQQFLLLYNNFPSKHPFSGVVKTNALPYSPNSVIGGIYPTIYLINLSCLPNTHNSWNSDTKCETIHTIHNINTVEELTISYNKGSSSDSRHTHLKDAFGFNYNCSVCSLALPKLKISDTRRLQIQHLDDAISDSDRVMNRPEDCLADCHSLLQVLEEEYYGGASASIPRLYYNAFQISITHSDQARASIFARRAHKSRVICEGEDSPETRKVKDLMENLAGHWNSAASTRWKTAKGLVPKGLNAGEFERWLWRQGR